MSSDDSYIDFTGKYASIHDQRLIRLGLQLVLPGADQDQTGRDIRGRYCGNCGMSWDSDVNAARNIRICAISQCAAPRATVLPHSQDLGGYENC